MSESIVQKAETAVVDAVHSAEASIAALFHKIEAPVVAEVAVVKAAVERTFESMLAEFDELVADVRKLEAHLGFSPKA